MLGAAQKELLDEAKREELLVVLNKARGEAQPPRARALKAQLAAHRVASRAHAREPLAAVVADPLPCLATCTLQMRCALSAPRKPSTTQRWRWQRLCTRCVGKGKGALWRRCQLASLHAAVALAQTKRFVGQAHAKQAHPLRPHPTISAAARAWRRSGRRPTRSTSAGGSRRATCSPRWSGASASCRSG